MKKFIAWSVGLVGALIFVLGLVAIIDPVGAQASNDSDPFGELSLLVNYALTIVGFLVVVVSIKIGAKRANE